MTKSHFVLAVPDATKTAVWWIETMGFQSWLDIEGWSFVRRDDCVIRLGSCPDAIHPRDLGDHQYFGYILADSLDAFHKEITARGADILFAPRVQPWEMLEMGVRTPDGHRIMFAQPLENER